MKQLNVIGQTISKTHLKIEKYNDGDCIFVKDLITNEVIEIRFYGIDAPELTLCKKLKQDELETSVSGRLLIELGYKSLEFLKTLVQINDPVTLIQERDNTKDKYGRTLGYLILKDGRIINEEMIKFGFAKAYNKIHCNQLPLYQELNLKAKSEGLGLYSYVKNF